MLLSKRSPAAGYPNAERKLRDHRDYFKKPEKSIYAGKDIRLVKQHFGVGRLEDDELYKSADKSRLMHLRNPLRENWSKNSSQASGLDNEKSLLYEKYRDKRDSSVMKVSRSIDQVLEERNPNRYKYRNHFHSYRRTSTEEESPAQVHNTSSVLLLNENSELNQSKRFVQDFRFKSKIPKSSKRLPFPSLHFELILPAGTRVEQPPKLSKPKKTLKEIIQECKGLSMAEDRMKHLEKSKAQEIVNEDARKQEFKTMGLQREYKFRDREWKQIMNNEKLIAELANAKNSDD